MGVQTLEDNCKEMVLFRQWEDQLKQQSTVNNQNTEDNLKILLRILFTITHNFYSYTSTWLCNICLVINGQNPNTLCRRLWSCSGIFFSNWKSRVQPTSTMWYFVLHNSKVSIIWLSDICPQCCYHSRNFPRSGYTIGKFNLRLHQWQKLEKV